jgi:uncharacterized protein (TIGR02145 family)
VGNNIQGICPNGWRLPTTKDLDSLFFYLGEKEVAGKKLKSMYGWYTNSGCGTNESGMNCYPAGLAIDHNVTLAGQQTLFWSTQTHPVFNSKAQVLQLFYDNDEAKLTYINKIQGNSVRCVKDL